ncbi:MAG: Glutamine--scyllo-inositol transaminase [Ferruginibacter sp.]|nr:Glutamine--scyllo-inositol transaminase [Ferruginibacter sp.]
MSIPFLNFNYMHQPIKGEIMQAFESFYDSNWYVLGERVKQFEAEYALFNGVNHVVGVSNGLDALHISLLALSIGVDDEVIVPANTYIASVLAVSFVGATPVFVEPRIDSFNINPELIEAAITPKTRVIMPVHLYGQACEMEAIKTIAERHGLYVIEDNAQAQGASYNGNLTGSWGDINGTSFYPGKNLGALGDAGAVTTSNEILAQKAMVLRNYGSYKKYYNEVIGHNMRLDECQAALLSVKLKYLDQWTKERQQIACWYDETLKEYSQIILPKLAEKATHVYHLYVIRTQQRDALQKHLAKNGIGTLIHYPIPPHLQNAYKHLGYSAGDFPITEEIADTSLSLPLWPGMTQIDVEAVSQMIGNFF